MTASTPMPLIPCPACGHQLSAQAISCPQCGHPIAAALPKPGESRASALFGPAMMAAMTFLTTGAGAAAVKLVTAGRGEALSDDTLVRLYMQTTPLTIAVTLIALSVIRKWWDDGASTLFFAAVVLLASVYLGSWFGNLGSLPSIQGSMITSSFRVLAFYWRHYGVSFFLASLLLGIFLAKVLSQQWETLVVNRRRR
jgi:zinc ribbon protein